MSLEVFGREIEVLVGPLQEWEGGGEESQALRFFANGSFDQLRIKFNVTKHTLSTSIPTKIEIYNLSSGTRNSLRESGLQIVLKVGWLGEGLSEIFKGSLVNSVSRREGPDIITMLLGMSGFGSISRAIVSKTWNSGSLLVNIIKELGESLPGITTSDNTIKINTPYKMGNQGWSTVGSVKEALDKLARTYGFSWWVSSGVFYALGDMEVFESFKTEISSENGFLLRAEPMLASPMQIQTGISIDSLLKTSIEPGRFVALKSIMNSNLDGDYKVHTVNHNGDSHSDNWSTRIQSWVVVSGQ